MTLSNGRYSGSNAAQVDPVHHHHVNHAVKGLVGDGSMTWDGRRDEWGRRRVQLL